jgi:hypothetical protein
MPIVACLVYIVLYSHIKLVRTARQHNLHILKEMLSTYKNYLRTEKSLSEHGEGPVCRLHVVNLC